MDKFKRIVFLCIVLLLNACAQQVAPTGGLKDEDPPQILSLNPPQESLNFSGDPIELEFDEFVKLNQLKQQFLASPPLSYPLETKIRGKKLSIEVVDTLEENTTYVFNFGNAIADFRENNPISGFKYVFSTGDKIDTLSIKGRVVEAFDLKVMEDMIVMLYDTSALGSLPYKRKPTYVDRTDKDGKFELTNLKAGEYCLFAISDENTNYLYDKPDELIAFIDRSLLLSTPLDSIKLYAFMEDREKQFIKSQKESGPQLILEFNRTIDTLQFRFLQAEDSINLLHYQKSSSADSLLLWFQQADKAEYEIIIIASPGYRDTIEVKIDSLEKRKLSLIKKPKAVHDFFKKVSLEFNRPIAEQDTRYLSVMRPDSTTFNYALEIDSIDAQRVMIKGDFQQDSVYIVSLLPKAFTDLYQQTHDSISFQFKLNKEGDFGNLYLKVSQADSLPKFVQLLGQSDKVLRQKDLEGQHIVFKNLKAGDYRLKLVIDRNGNQVWDTGNFNKNLQAEKVYYYEDKLTIRANWDQEIEWRILPASK
jgi:hypothetical protein